MNNKKLFSAFYSTDIELHEDKIKFRNRILKYLEDFVRRSFPYQTYLKCRSEMGISLKTIPHPQHPYEVIYCIEDTFNSADTPITDILDLITVVYDSVADSLLNSTLDKDTLETFISEVNRLFQEESMCYVIHDNGCVRFYPDEEFHQAVRCTLTILNKPAYADNLTAFNNVLEELYKHHSKESPINELFKCIETFILSIIKDKSYNRLNNSSSDKLMNKIDGYVNSDSSYAPHDKESVTIFRGILLKWVEICHKYRHGKANQVNHDVPTELFNQIFSMGISIFRFLLEMDAKYNIK